MSKIFKNLWQVRKSVLVIILLLIVQAYCDLALPGYTSDIVDVGIQQGGIEHVAPEVVSAQTLQNLCLLLPQEKVALVDVSYDKNADGNLELNDYGKTHLETLDAYFGMPMLLISSMEEQQSENESAPADMQIDPRTMDISTLREMVESGSMTKEQILDIADKAAEQMEQASGDMTDSIVKQRALLFVQKEYEGLGIDLGKYQMNYLLRTGAQMLGFAIASMLAAIFVGLLASQPGARIGMTLRDKVFKKVVSFSNNEMNSFSTASLITRSTNDIQQVQMVSTMTLRMVLYAPIVGIGGIIRVSQTKTGLGWIIVVAVVTIVCLIGVLMAIAMPKFKIMQTLVDKLNLVSREILTGIPVIRAFSREKYEEKRFAGANTDLMKTQLFTNRVMTFMMPVMMVIMNALSVMIVWFGSKGVDAGTMQVGDMMAFITYTMMIVMAFLMITMMSIMLPRAGVAATRIDEVIQSESSIYDKPDTVEMKKETAKGILSFEDVSFRYPGADADALEHISFTAEPGKTTAIIGSTGCGKSTILHLMTRFYDVTEGAVKVDGVDVRDMSQHDLHALIGLVPQKGILFSGTIASNIKFEGDTVTDDKMKEAARIAQATEFIENKKDMYDSPIAQGGSNVSGGQKQRLSIARAIAKDPKIYLFDDSFSALDYKTDIVLRQALHEKTESATVIIVAQRISTIMHADQIIVLEEGRVAGIGTHEKLLADCEAYREIAGSQLSEAELKGGR